MARTANCRPSGTSINNEMADEALSQQRSLSAAVASSIIKQTGFCHQARCATKTPVAVFIVQFRLRRLSAADKATTVGLNRLKTFLLCCHAKCCYFYILAWQMRCMGRVALACVYIAKVSRL